MRECLIIEYWDKASRDKERHCQSWWYFCLDAKYLLRIDRNFIYGVRRSTVYLG